MSAAYYALFHFLIEESKSNWRGQKARKLLARAYEHGLMRIASSRVMNQAFPGQDPQIVAKLKFVALTFVLSQDQRHNADYNTETSWSRAQALEIASSVEKAFQEWEAIRKDPIVEEYLLTLLIKQRS